jgi:hypothetical protein
MSISFIDPLLALPGQDTKLVSEWQKLVTALKQFPEMRDARLLEAITVDDLPPLGPFTHVAVLEWSCTESFRSALSDKTVQSYLANLRATCLSHSGVFGQIDA